jgi:hypothetical protein
MSDTLITVKVGANELQIALLGLRFRLEDNSFPDELKAPYLAAYLAVEKAWLKGLYPQRSRFPAGACLQIAPLDKPAHPVVLSCFQKSTKQLFERWLQSQKRTTRPLSAPLDTAL